MLRIEKELFMNTLQALRNWARCDGEGKEMRQKTRTTTSRDRRMESVIGIVSVLLLQFIIFFSFTDLTIGR